MFQEALKTYRKQTKNDLLAHPLASQLESCDSTTAILSLLQDQIREFDKSHSGDERLTRWLGPTMNVLCAFSAAVSGGVGAVSFYTRTNVGLEASSDTDILYASGICACQCDLCRHQRLCLSKYPVYFFTKIDLTVEILKAAQDVAASKDVLAELFERIGYFFTRLETYTSVVPTPTMTDIITKILVEVLRIFGIATKELRRGTASEFRIGYL